MTTGPGDPRDPEEDRLPYEQRLDAEYVPRSIEAALEREVAAWIGQLAKAQALPRRTAALLVLQALGRAARQVADLAPSAVPSVGADGTPR